MKFIAGKTHVHFINADGTLDESATGIILEYPAIDPEGTPHYGIAAVSWDGDQPDSDDWDLIETDRLHSLDVIADDA